MYVWSVWENKQMSIRPTNDQLQGAFFKMQMHFVGSIQRPQAFYLLPLMKIKSIDAFNLIPFERITAVDP